MDKPDEAQPEITQEEKAEWRLNESEFQALQNQLQTISDRLNKIESLTPAPAAPPPPPEPETEVIAATETTSEELVISEPPKQSGEADRRKSKTRKRRFMSKRHPK